MYIQLRSFFCRVPISSVPRNIRIINTTILMVRMMEIFPRIGSRGEFRSNTCQIASIAFFNSVRFAILICKRPNPAEAGRSSYYYVRFFLRILRTTRIAFSYFSRFTSKFFLQEFQNRLRRMRVIIRCLSHVVRCDSIQY